MRQGKSLMELGSELQRQRLNRQDFIADTRSLQFHTNQVSVLHIFTDTQPLSFEVSDIAHSQIASRLNIPARYYQKMQAEAPDLLDHNVNTWLQKKPERRMIRTLDGQARAFLSARYRRLDNLELCAAVLPVVQEMKGATIASCEVTPAHLYLKVINKRLKAEVDVGDVVQAGFVVSNSEVGLGSLRVEPLVYRLVCKNGLICKDFSSKKYHVGRQLNYSDDDAYELYSENTLAQDDKAFFLKVQDVVRAAVDETKFQLSLDKLRLAKNTPLEHEPVKSVQRLADKFQLSQPEQGEILRHLFMGSDCSQYGLINAVTAASQLSATYERATELERIGGELLNMCVPRPMLPAAHTTVDISPSWA